MARKRTRNCSCHAGPAPSRTRRFCSSTGALQDRCCWGSIPSVRIAGYTHLISTSWPTATVNYGGGTDYGLDYREADDLVPGGGSVLNDLLVAITYLRGRHAVDFHSLGIWIS